MAHLDFNFSGIIVRGSTPSQIQNFNVEVLEVNKLCGIIIHPPSFEPMILMYYEGRKIIPINVWNSYMKKYNEISTNVIKMYDTTLKQIKNKK